MVIGHHGRYINTYLLHQFKKFVGQKLQFIKKKTHFIKLSLHQCKAYLLNLELCRNIGVITCLPRFPQVSARTYLLHQFKKFVGQKLQFIKKINP